MTQARTLNNRYELQSKIGDGGMAAVYKALDIKLNRTVAVKILRDSYAADPQFLARFKREAQQAASLNHPNIVRVFDVGDEDDYHYIVMEYVEGSNLKDLIVQQAPLPPARALEIAAEICDALAYSHQTGLIHRDVKPQNILLDKTGHVRVTDFGIAKSSNAATLTEAGITMGTVHYFSPEQAKGQPVSPQSDIYSIGIVLFEMLTGSIPFDSDNPVALAMKHIEEPPPPPRSINPNIPPAIERIVLKALAKEPAQRWSSADELARALRSIEQQAEQGTAVRPAIAPLTGFQASAPVRPVAPVPAPVPGATAVNPVRPVAPAYPVAYNRVPVAPERSGPVYYQDRPSQVYRREADDYEYEDEPRRRGGGCWPWIIGAIALLLIAALAVAAVVALPNLTRPAAVATATPQPEQPTATAVPPTNTPAQAAKVKVPEVLGRTRAEAENLLKNANLQSQVREENSQNVEAGRVIAADPKVGTEVDRNSKVTLVISKGRETAVLPAYENVNPDAAEKQLRDLGYVVERVEEHSDTVQKGAVIRTDPKGGPGVTATKGSTVKLIISKGPVPPTATAVPPTNTPVPATATPRPASVAVPNVVGQKRDVAEKAVREAGFVPKIVEWDEEDLRREFGSDPAVLQQALRTYNQLKKNEVLGTNPPGQAQAPKGSEVIIAIKKD